MENLKVEELKYKSVYESPEWTTIHPIARAQLLLVAEDVKRGTIIGGDRYIFPRIVAKLGLDASLNSDIGDPKAVYAVARPDILRSYLSEGNRLLESDPMEIIHQINGRFLGYPDCCVKEYSNPTVTGLEPRFREELRVDMAQNDGNYPPEFNFRPPSFTPCSAKCYTALATLNTWMHMIQAADSEAAQQLTEFNRAGFVIFDPNIRLEPLIQPRILKIARKIWRTLSLK